MLAACQDDADMAIYLDANVLWSWRTFAEADRLALSIVAHQAAEDLAGAGHGRAVSRPQCCRARRHGVRRRRLNAPNASATSVAPRMTQTSTTIPTPSAPGASRSRQGVVSAGALAQHRDRGNDEHDDEGEQATHRRPDRLEGLRLTIEDVAHQREQPDGHREQQRNGAWVAPDLPQHAPSRSQRHPGAHEDARSMIARNALPRSCSPVWRRNCSGVVCSSRVPSRISSSSSHSLASSIT